MPPSLSAACLAELELEVTTTTLSLSEIARRKQVHRNTVSELTKRHGWVRPAEAQPQFKLGREKRPATQRLYEKRGTVADLAVVVGCSTSRLRQVAAEEGWVRPRGAARAPSGSPPDPRLAEIEAALRAPIIGSGDLWRLIQQALAIVTADALAGRDPQAAEALMQHLAKAAAIAKAIPETAAPPIHTDDHAHPADHFPDANDLIEEIARRFEAFSEEWMDPRILEAVAATVR